MALDCDHPRANIALPPKSPARLNWQPPALIPGLPLEAQRVIRESLQGIYDELTRLSATRVTVPLLDDLIYALPGQIIEGVANGQTIVLPLPTPGADPISIVIDDVAHPVTVVNPDGTVITIDKPGVLDLYPGLEAWLASLGLFGSPGLQGPPGADGEGYPGPVGQDGRPGRDGAPGGQGPPGERGEDGVSVVGPEGRPGIDGLGTQGPPGADGVDGLDGTPGATGGKGDRGNQGPPGPPGEDGRDGLDGVGATGPVGLRGDQGPPGPPGEDGRDGLDGKDAVLNPNSVDNAALANMPGGTVKGRQVDAGTGDPVDLVGSEVGELIRYSTGHGASGAADLTDYAVDTDLITHIRIDPGADILFNSLQAPTVSGKQIRITKLANSNRITIVDEAVAGTAAMRFTCIGNTVTPNIVLRHAGSNVLVEYDGTRWAVIEWNPGIATVDNAGLVDADVVSNAMLVNVAAGTIKGRQIDAGTGDPVDLTGAEVAEIIRWSNVATEATGGTLNNYALSALVDVLRFTATAVLSGVTGGTTGRRLVIANGAAAGSGVTVDLVQFATSTSGNRFLLPKATALRLYPGDAIEFLWGTLSNEWCALESSKALYRSNSSGLGVSRTRLNFIDSATVAFNAVDVGASDEVTLTPAVVPGSIGSTELATMAQSRIKGRAEGAGTGAPQDLTPTQVVAIIDAENATWTGTHAFTGTVSATTATDVLVTTTAGVGINAGHSSGNVATGNFAVNSTAMSLVARSGTPVYSTAAGGIDIDAADDLRVNGAGGAVFASSTALPTEAATGNVHIVADGVVRVFTAAVERLEIEADGAWQIEGNTGSAGDVLTSQGSAASPIWTPVGESLRPNSAYWVLRDDFSGGEFPTQGIGGETGWIRVRTGDAGGEATGVASESNHPGIIRLSTSTTQQTVALVRGNNGAGLAQGHDLTRCDQVQYFEWIVKTGASVGSTDALIGLQQDALTSEGGTAGVYFRLTGDNGFPRGVCRTGSTSTTVTFATILTAATWYRLQATRSGSTWSFTVNGSAAQVISTNIPTSTFCQMGASQTNSTSADRTLDLDYFGLVSSALTR